MPWLDMIDIDTKSVLQLCSNNAILQKSFASLNESKYQHLYPSDIIEGKTYCTTFNQVQKLYCNGILPTKYALEFWILFLIAHAPTLQAAITTIIVHYCTFCTVDVEASPIPIYLLINSIVSVAARIKSSCGVEDTNFESIVDNLELRLAEYFRKPFTLSTNS